MTAISPAANSERLAIENVLSWLHAKDLQLLLADFIIGHGGAATISEMLVDPELALYVQGVFVQDIAAGEPTFLRALTKATHLFGQRGEHFYVRVDLGSPPSELLDITKRVSLGRIETGALPEAYSELTVLALSSIRQRGGVASFSELASDLGPYLSGAFVAGERAFFSAPCTLQRHHLDGMRHLKSVDGAFSLAEGSLLPSELESAATRALCTLRRTFRERLTAPSIVYSLLIDSCRRRNGDVECDVAPLLPNLCTVSGERFTLSVHELIQAAPFYFRRLKKTPNAGDVLPTTLDVDLDQVRKVRTPAAIGTTILPIIVIDDDSMDARRPLKRTRKPSTGRPQVSEEDKNESFSREQNAQLDILIRATLAERGALDLLRLVQELYHFYAGIIGKEAYRNALRRHTLERLRQLGAEECKDGAWRLPTESAPNAIDVLRVKAAAQTTKATLGGCTICSSTKHPRKQYLCGKCAQHLRQSKAIGAVKRKTEATNGEPPKPKDAEPNKQSQAHSSHSLASPAVAPTDDAVLLPVAASPFNPTVVVRLLVTDEEELESDSRFKHYTMVCLTECSVTALKQASATALKLSGPDSVSSVSVLDEILKAFIVIDEDWQVCELSKHAKIAVRRKVQRL